MGVIKYQYIYSKKCIALTPRSPEILHKTRNMNFDNHSNFKNLKREFKRTSCRSDVGVKVIRRNSFRSFFETNPAECIAHSASVRVNDPMYSGVAVHLRWERSGLCTGAIWMCASAFTFDLTYLCFYLIIRSKSHNP